MSYILALDQGTTSSRAILFDRKGQILQVAQQEFSQFYPHPGWVEHIPDEIFNTQMHVARECLRQAQIAAHDVLAVGLANQRETTIVWDRASGTPLYNAIVWQDRRTAGICDTLRAEGKDELIRKKTGLLLDAYFSATKIAWILDNVPNARARAEKGELMFGTVDTWLIWNFSKREAHVTDPSNASRTLLFNIHTGTWDDELLEIFRVPKTMLPEICPSSGIMAKVHPEFLGQALPIAGVAGDQQAATFGNACLKQGMVKNTYGTGCFLLLNTGKESKISQNNLLTTVAWNTGQDTMYALEGSVFVGGALIQWLRDGLGFIRDASELETLASSVPDNGGICLVPAFTGLGAPWWDPYARGIICGLTRGTTRGHIARASVEAIALQTLDVLEALQADAGLSCSVLRVDGGASRNNMLMQYQADLTGVVVERPKITETTALGAAFLAGLAVKFWENEEALAAIWQLDRRFEPQMSQEKREELVTLWHKAVKRAKSWLEES